MLKLSKKCREINYSRIINPKSPICIGGYIDNLISECHECPHKCPCRDEFGVCELIDIDMSNDDFRAIIQVSQDVNFVEAMISLKQKDIIEYNLKLSQFKSQLGCEVSTEETNKPHCPTCSSTDIKHISSVSKATSVALFGIFSQKVKKQYHCNSCNYEW